jgi:hypothetical protein
VAGLRRTRLTGRCAILQPGRYDSLGAMGLNDSISSVRPVGGSRADVPIAAPGYAPGSRVILSVSRRSRPLVHHRPCERQPAAPRARRVARGVASSGDLRRRGLQRPLRRACVQAGTVAGPEWVFEGVYRQGRQQRHAARRAARYAPAPVVTEPPRYVPGPAGAQVDLLRASGHAGQSLLPTGRSAIWSDSVSIIVPRPPSVAGEPWEGLRWPRVQRSLRRAASGRTRRWARWA